MFGKIEFSFSCLFPTAIKLTYYPLRKRLTVICWRITYFDRSLCSDAYGNFDPTKLCFKIKKPFSFLYHISYFCRNRRKNYFYEFTLLLLDDRNLNQKLLHIFFLWFQFFFKGIKNVGQASGTIISWLSSSIRKMYFSSILKKTSVKRTDKEKLYVI